MAVPFLSVNLRTPECDFEPLMLAPEQPMLDLPAGQASGRVLRKWLGDLVAEPCWTSTGVVYFLPPAEATRSAAARPQCIVPRDLRSGPIRDQYLKLCTSLSRVQSERGEAALLSAVCKSFESQDRATRLDHLGDCLFKYRDGQKQWRLIWAWGYRRKAERLGAASLCPRCSLLSVQTPEALHCPACGWRSRSRLLAAAALAALLLAVGLGLWAATRPSTAPPKIVADQVAITATAGTEPVQQLPDIARPVPSPVATHAEEADAPIAKASQPIQPLTAGPQPEAVRPAVVIHPATPPQPMPPTAAPPKPALAEIHPINVHPINVAPAATRSRAVSTARRPAEIIAPASAGQMPQGVTIDQDGKVFLGYRQVTPTFDATTQFAPNSHQPSRYIYGSHVYAESQDELQGGDPAFQQWQHYVMSDEESARPANADGSDHSVSLIVLDRGTDAEISNSATPGVDTWADTGSPVHLVQTVASKTVSHCKPANRQIQEPGESSAGTPMPRFDLTLDRPEPFYPTTPRCHGKHHYGRHGGYGPYVRGATDPALFRRFTPSYHEPALDAQLTVVALQYFGHSSPDEVLADLEAARAKVDQQAITDRNRGSHRAILQLCDSEIALWRDVVDSSSTADAATAASKAGDERRAGELCRDYQAQVAAYAGRPEWSLFATQSQRVTALAATLSSQPTATR